MNANTTFQQGFVIYIIRDNIVIAPLAVYIFRPNGALIDQEFMACCCELNALSTPAMRASDRR